MDENNNVSKEVVKRKTNWGFTLFACIATGVIVFLAMNLGEKAGKIVDPDTNGSSSNVTSNQDSNSNSNEVSNSNSNIDSNVNSNVESNVTSNQPTSNVTSNTTKTIASIAGKYDGSLPIKDGEGKAAQALYSLTIKADGTCSYGRGVSGGGVTLYNGTCTLNGNNITLTYTEVVQNQTSKETGTHTFTLNSDNTINYNETPGLGNVTLRKTK